VLKKNGWKFCLQLEIAMSTQWNQQWQYPHVFTIKQFLVPSSGGLAGCMMGDG